MTTPLLLRSDDVEIELLPRGATIRAMRVRDRAGGLVDVTLFPRDPALQGPDCGYMGATVGRCANRIAGARFTLDGVEHRLSANEGRHALHGGREGFDSRDWTVDEVTSSRARLRLVSEDGDQGFPGRVVVVAEFAVDGPVVSITYAATTDAPTPLNLTNHTYLNLSGEGSATALDHTLEVSASRYTPVDDDQLPTGGVASIDGSPLDFRRPRRPGAHVDHNLVLEGTGLREVATLRSPVTGISLTLATDQPGLQVYTGDKLDGSVVGKSGTVYGPNSGIALEPQGFPDAVNRPGFPGVVLRPGERYFSRIAWRLSSD